MASPTEPQPIFGRRTYGGGCHCGAVAFECELDLGDGTQRCNCSICSKSRYWKAMVKAEDFRLLRGEAALSEYRFNTETIRHRFCRYCGVKIYGSGAVPELGPFYAINVACLDGLQDTERAALPIRYEDGRNGAYDRRPAETRYL